MTSTSRSGVTPLTNQQAIVAAISNNPTRVRSTYLMEDSDFKGQTQAATHCRTAWAQSAIRAWARSRGMVGWKLRSTRHWAASSSRLV